MSRKSSCCGICENVNCASICAICVNYRLNEYHTMLKSLKSRRDLLYSRLSEVLVAKGKADDQLNWRLVQNEKLACLREKLLCEKEQLGRAKIERMYFDLNVKYGVLESASSVLETNRIKQGPKLNKSVWNINSAISSSTLLESAHALHLTQNIIDYNLPSSATSFLDATEVSDAGKNEIDGWDLVEHPTFPPPPSQTEDVEHWTRAMFIDATD